MRRLIEHVLALPETELATLTIQDAAICHVWLANGGPSQDPIEGCDTLEGKIKQWLAVAAPSAHATEGRRTQTLLRELIDRAQSDAVDTMSRDELDLLETVYSFAHAAQHHTHFERVRRLIAPRRARMAARRMKLPPVAGLPALAKRLLVVRGEELLEAPHREVRVLAGIELPARGPVKVHAGHVRVLGDVPDGVTLVVEEADCVVDGYVMGRLAASGNCEIKENVSGVAISRNGDIRARNIIENGFVVAKRGRVQCRRVHGARMVFAGEAIHIAESAARSLLLAPTVTIGESAESGRIHVSQSAQAGRFGGGDAALDVYLRRGLSCRDYGENPGRAMASDVARALRARANLHAMREQISIAIQTAEQSAATCLMYLLATEDSGRAAEEIHTAQRRLDVLNRIMLGLRTLYAEAEAQEHDDSTEQGNPESYGPSVLDRIDAELKAMAEDGPEDESIAEMRRDLESACEQRRSRKLLRYSLDDTVKKLERWQRESVTLRESIRRAQQTLARTGRLKEILGGDTRSRIVSLRRILARAKTESPDSTLRIRAGSAFVARMTKGMEKRLAEARELNGAIEDARSEFDAARQHLLNQYQMRIDEEDAIHRCMFIEGVFAGAVRIHYDPRYVADGAMETTDETSLVTPCSGGGRVRYVCSGGKIREEEAAETAVESGLAAV